MLRCLLLIPSLDCNKLLDALELYGRAQLYQRPDLFLKHGKGTVFTGIVFAECENGLLPVKPISLKSRAILFFITDGCCLLQKI